MEKHTPVLLNEVLREFSKIISQKDEIVAIDCTLGQAGHSNELFKKIQRGVLISIDLDIKTIEWVANYFSEEFEVESYELTVKGQIKNCFKLTLKTPDSYLLTEKTWYILQSDFSMIDEVLEALKLFSFDFILADLGFSNYQLTQNKGISFDRSNQRLDMRYESLIKHEELEIRNEGNQQLSINDSNSSKSINQENSLTAAEVLNTFSKSDLETILRNLGQIDKPEKLVGDIIQIRKDYPFEKVSDIVRILNRPKYPSSYKYKFFQALRSFVNRENERLALFLEKIQNVLSKNGTATVISFNSIEDTILQSMLQDIQIIEPNITEIIRNKQSRSAKLYIYNKNERQDKYSP